MRLWHLWASAVVFAILSQSILAQPTRSRAQGPLRPPISQSGRKKVYVAPFTARGALSQELLDSFTDEFETLFIDAGCYEVLERRDLDQLLRQIRNERGLTTIRDLGISAAQVQGTGATAVVFGVINDDVNSGEVVLSVKMEYFDSTIAWKNQESLQRGRREDRASRLEAIRRLISHICGDKGARTEGGSGQLEEIGGLQFGLQSCSVSRDRVVCGFTVTSPGQDRRITLGGICCWQPSELYDQGGNPWKHTTMTLGNVAGDSRVADYLLVRDVPVKATMTFPISADVESIPLMKIWCTSGGQNWEVKFRDITPVRR